MLVQWYVRTIVVVASLLLHTAWTRGPLSRYLWDCSESPCSCAPNGTRKRKRTADIKLLGYIGARWVVGCCNPCWSRHIASVSIVGGGIVDNDLARPLFFVPFCRANKTEQQRENKRDRTRGRKKRTTKWTLLHRRNGDYSHEVILRQILRLRNSLPYPPDRRTSANDCKFSPTTAPLHILAHTHLYKWICVQTIIYAYLYDYSISVYIECTLVNANNGA